MLFVTLVAVGLFVGLTTVLFGFGGGFVAVPVIAWANHGLGARAVTVATATSLVVMVANALVATLATPRSTLRWLRPRAALLVSLAAGGLVGVLLPGHLPASWIRWGFVAYIGLTFLDLVLRRGFVSTRGDADHSAHALPAWLGVPIGAVATLLGVGGSVMTVPALRRAGAPMQQATSLANPLTLAIVTPATVVALTRGASAGTHVDTTGAAALLLGALPVIVLLRRNPPRLPDRVHAVGYLALLVVSGVAVALA